MNPTSSATPLHSIKPMPCMVLNRIFTLIYTIALLFLLYHHATKLLQLQPTTSNDSSFFIIISMFVADLILGFLWITSQAFRFRPVTRQVFPENLEKVVRKSDYPGLDIFICTADPYKEPPFGVVNTALSLLAYDYPVDKLSVYVSDDGGSELTLFAFMEAAKFAAHWLAFCRENEVLDRCPEVFFRSKYYYPINSEADKIKAMYDKMKNRIENAVQMGMVDECVDQTDHEALSKWRDVNFTSQNHPTVIQVLLESNKDKDEGGHTMPNLIYVSREKRTTSPHHFKAGALNTLLRVSAVMTNAPIILIQDCDMFSNDPRTPHNVLCYFMDDSIRPILAYIQFPQCFHGLNKNDIYSSEMKRWFQINPAGMDGLCGPDNMGSGCFFMRRAFFGGPSPSSFVPPEMPELSPDHVIKHSGYITAEDVLEHANIVAACDYENQTKWGYEIGFRYGSLVEDYFTGYCLHSVGWKSIFCHPRRPAFLGNIPNSLTDVVNQHKRWCVGLLEVAFSKYSPLTYGMQTNLDPLGSLCYASYAFSPLCPIPIIIYSFLPQLTLLNNVFIFPKVSSCWFLLYVFLFLGSYIQDCLEFMLTRGTLARWWNEQRIWLIRGFTSYLLGSLEYLLKTLGFSTHGFNVTSKVVDEEQSRRYDEGTFDFGPSSSSIIFLPLATAAVLNLVAVLACLLQNFTGPGDFDGAFLQLFVSGFGTLNCLPIYGAMVLRSDKGRMPLRTTICSVCLAWGLYLAIHFIISV